MYERMLDKAAEPSFEEMLEYCGSAGIFWRELDGYLITQCNAEDCIRFPYGKKYGWSKKYSHKNKLICDVFAEQDAVFVLIRMADDVMESIYKELGDYAKDVWNNKYPCGSGGWLNYRITEKEQLDDLIKIINRKIA